MSAGTEFCFDTFIRFVKVYTDKIEIGLNYGFNTPGNEKEPVTKKYLQRLTRQPDYFKVAQSKQRIAIMMFTLLCKKKEHTSIYLKYALIFYLLYLASFCLL